MKELSGIGYLENETGEADIIFSDAGQNADSRVSKFLEKGRDQHHQELMRALSSFIDESGDHALYDILKISSQNARLFIQQIPLHVEPPEVTVDDEGEIVFEWISKNNDRLSVAIGPHKTIHYAAHSGGERHSGRVKLNGSLSDILKLMLSEIFDRAR